MGALLHFDFEGEECIEITYYVHGTRQVYSCFRVTMTSAVALPFRSLRLKTLSATVL